MKIGELARLSQLSASRIRFYETQGLIPGARRGANGYREFPAQSLQLLEIIQKAQQAGFALDEIRALLPGATSQQLDHQTLVASLKRKVAEIEAFQLRLEQNRLQLQAVIESIESKPEGLRCDDGWKRVVANLRETPMQDAESGTSTNTAVTPVSSDLQGAR